LLFEQNSSANNERLDILAPHPGRHTVFSKEKTISLAPREIGRFLNRFLAVSLCQFHYQGIKKKKRMQEGLELVITLLIQENYGAGLFIEDLVDHPESQILIILDFTLFEELRSQMKEPSWMLNLIEDQLILKKQRLDLMLKIAETMNGGTLYMIEHSSLPNFFNHLLF
jgi:hypothetical protein